MKTASARIALVMTALAEGVGVAVATRIFGHSEFTIQTWLTRSRMHAQSLHEPLLCGLHLEHLQLDGVGTAIRHGSQIVWVWIAIDVRSKLIVAMHIGPRTLEMAQTLVHTLIHILWFPPAIPSSPAMGWRCTSMPLPVTSSVGPRRPFTAAALAGERSTPVWSGQEVLSALARPAGGASCNVRRSRAYHSGTAALRALGFTGTLQTAFVERYNGTLGHGDSTLVRGTGGKAQPVGELTLHLEWFRAYYSFDRPQGSLREALETPLQLSGRVQKYRSRTPMMVAGVASGIGTSMALIFGCI